MTERIPVSHVARAAIVITIGLCFGLVVFTLFGKSGENSGSLSASMEPRAELLQTMKTGGLGREMDKDDEVTDVVKQIKPLLEAKTNTKYEYLEVVSYKTQIVAGKNYFVKAKAKPENGAESIIHLRIYRDLSRKLELTAHETDKSLNDELKWFQ